MRKRRVKERGKNLGGGWMIQVWGYTGRSEKDEGPCAGSPARSYAFKPQLDLKSNSSILDCLQ
jgi:hypothetical protein